MFNVPYLLLVLPFSSFWFINLSYKLMRLYVPGRILNVSQNEQVEHA